MMHDLLPAMHDSAAQHLLRLEHHTVLGKAVREHQMCKATADLFQDI